MTRKQALELAVKALNEAQQHEAAEILHTLSDELPLNRWTEAAIRDAVEQFILERGRAPTATDFKKRCLPPHTVVRKRMGITLQEWLERDYSAAKPTEEEIRAKATEVFVQDYLRIRPKSGKEFNEKRRPKTHCWYTVASYHDTRRWRLLLEKLDLPVYSKREIPNRRPQLTVNIITDFDFEIEGAPPIPERAKAVG